MGRASRFDSAPLQTELDLENPRWRKWFQDVWASINAISMPQASNIGVTASPMTWQYIGAGQASLIVEGTGVTRVELSRNGAVFYQVSLLAGMFAVSQGDYLRITYGAAPILTLVPR